MRSIGSGHFCAITKTHPAVLPRRPARSIRRGRGGSLNPILDDRPLALLLREGELSDIGPKVLAAARQFAAVG